MITVINEEQSNNANVLLCAGRELVEIARSKGRELSLDMYLDDDYSDSVGGADKGNFEYEGEIFEIKVNAFWENVKHFDYSVDCKGRYKNFSESCVEFQPCT